MVKINHPEREYASHRFNGKRPQFFTRACLMLRPPVTIPIVFVHGMLSGAQSRGRPCDAYLMEAGIAPELLQEPHARVTVDQYLSLFRLLTERLDDECLDFLSRPLKRGSFALVARSAIHASTVETAIRRVANTFRLLQNDVAMELVSDGELASLTLRFSNPEVAHSAFLHELLLRGIWRLSAWLSGGQLPAVRFDFAFAMPAYASSYGKIFPAELRFDAPQSALWFEAGRLKGAMRQNDNSLRVFLDTALTQVIVPRRVNDVLSARTRNHLQQTQPDWPDLSATAQALHMSTATLQRHLAGEGTSFQSLKDELRRDIAIMRLNTGAVSLAALAQDLGFTESTAFQRAFKSWTGSPPGAYRRGGAGD
jgi:AraC-like DNA-binding protein